MTIQNEQINRTRDLFNADIYKGQAGTGTSSPTPEDSGLETADATTLADVTTVTGDKSVQVTFVIPSTTGATTAYSEQETQSNSGATEVNRITHTALTKGSNEQYNYITNYFFKSG